MEEKQMKRKIMIGSKEITLEANGLTPMKYRRAFPKRDIIRELIEIDEMEEGEDIDLELYDRLAYVMSGAPDEGTDFETWLGGFGPTDIFMASVDIMDVWNGNAVSQSEGEEEQPKKLQAEEG